MIRKFQIFDILKRKIIDDHYLKTRVQKKLIKQNGSQLILNVT